MNFKDSYSKYYNLFYAEKDYDSEVKYVDKIIREYKPGSKTILEYGSGTGGHGVLLKKLGYTIFGLERSTEMVELAQQRGYDCMVGNITDFKLEKKFDVCLALFHVVSYLNTNQQLLDLLRLTKAHLLPGGLFIFDVWFTPAVIHQKPEIRNKTMSGDTVEVERIATPTINYLTNIVNVNYQVTVKEKASGKTDSFTEDHSMRHFSYTEIELLANQSGFTIEKAEEFGTGNNPTINTWGVNFILKANG